MSKKVELSRRVGKAFSSATFKALTISELSDIREAVEKATNFSDLDGSIQRLIRKAESG